MEACRAVVLIGGEMPGCNCPKKCHAGHLHGSTAATAVLQQNKVPVADPQASRQLMLVESWQQRWPADMQA